MNQVCCGSQVCGARIDEGCVTTTRVVVDRDRPFGARQVVDRRVGDVGQLDDAVYRSALPGVSDGV